MKSKDSLFARTVCQIIRLSDIVVFLGLWCFALHDGERSVIWVGGLVTSMVGFAFWMVVRLQLGNSFSIAAEAKELVTSGLYRHFRHPIYLFGVLGALVALQNWAIVGVWLLAITPIQVARMRKEEEAFGDTFRETAS